MYSLKGFVSVNGLANASPTAVAAIGEISDLSLTYSLGQGEYASPSLKYILRSFYSQTAVGATGVPALLQSQIFAFVDWAFTLQQSGTPATSATAFTAAMQAQFGAQANSIGCGSMINNGTFLFPEFITWVNPSLTTNDPTAGGLIKLWFADASFQSQYDEYVIKVVPPLPSIDTFMSGATAVQSALASYSLSQFIAAMQTARAGSPETELLTQTYDYVDPTNSANQITTNWGILIYGAAGNNVDNIRTAVQQYIAANSQYSVDKWKAIFPEIYKTTEFLIFPRWLTYAIKDMVLTQGAYSPITTLQKELSYLDTVLSDYTSAFIAANLCVFPVQYKSLACLALPGSTNDVAEQSLLNLFPDYLNVPTSDTSYNLMASKTRGWIGMLIQMLIIAEQATVQSTLPAGMSTAVRDQVLFVAQEYAGVTYLVATKGTTPAY